MGNPFSGFHPAIRDWFEEAVGEPTPIQCRAWPLIARGEHVLATAPTGSGKTLAAFLWALNQLFTGTWEAGRTRVLYVSPLKALNNDVRRNLLEPLEGLRTYCADKGLEPPEIRVATRSGDTDASERRRMLRHPPEILITTPESLNLLLSSPRAQHVLSGLRTVILDEIHAVTATKRGTHLITAVDRLVRLSGEFQRVALSATVRPLDTVAEFVGGLAMTGPAASPHYKARKLHIVADAQAKQYDVRVRTLHEDETAPPRKPAFFWPQVAGVLARMMAPNRSTLIFTNSRRLSERLSMLINQEEDAAAAYSHHGSLSREMRELVEQRMKRGDLKAIVATSSLELGIDVGSLDEVILVQPPLSVAAAVQRIGRAGHHVGVASRGAFFCAHGRDLLDAAVMARRVLDQDIEAIRPIEAPLDVLAQVLVSMVGIDTWDLDDLYGFIKTSWPYRHLPRRHFDLVVDMLAGRYAESRLRVLKPLIAIDRMDNETGGGKASVRGGAMLTLYSSGGTIPDRGYYTLRHARTNAKIGELDEEFVWERKLGDTFALGMQSWRVSKITHNDVLAEPVPSSMLDVPFWRAEDLDRSFSLSSSVAEFLEEADTRLAEPAFADELRDRYRMTEEAAEALLAFLKRQRAATGGSLPHRHHLLIENLTAQDAPKETTRVMLHTLWGGRVNRPFAAALAQAWQDHYGQTLQVSASNDGLLLLLPEDTNASGVFSLVSASGLEALLRKQLERTGFFGARFRENAARALLLPRGGFKRRMPLWLSRVRAKRLLETAARYNDFPIVLETWRTCLRDDFDIESLAMLLDELETGRIRYSEVTTASPSPFAENGLFHLTNELMYADDKAASGGTSKLDEDLLREAVRSPELRPEIPAEVIRTFERKAQRVFPGYAPATASDLLEWLKDRLFVPETEWRTLLEAIDRDHGGAEAMLAELADKVATLALPDGGGAGTVALESLPRLLRAFALAPEDIRAARLGGEPLSRWPKARSTAKAQDEDPLAVWLGEWLRFYGPITARAIRERFPLSEERLSEVLDQLIESGAMTVDAERFCDAENMEMLLRLTRRAARPQFEPLPAEALPLFLAQWQSVAAHNEGPDGLQRALEGLFGYPVSAPLLESELLPARVAKYQPPLLDEVFAASDLVWMGLPKKRAFFASSFAVDLFAASRPAKEEDATALFPDPRGRYDFSMLAEHTGLSTTELTQKLWAEVWAGRASNDSFGALRKGIETKFAAIEPAQGRKAGARRASFRAWKSSRAYPGNWYRVTADGEEGDALDAEETNKERVRVLLERHGILFRALLSHELPRLRWGALFATLRRMELAGELLTGYFFDDLPAPQFIAHDAFQRLQRGLDEEAVYWLNACDPASLCGVDVPRLKQGLPRRLPTNHLVYHGRRLVIVSTGNAKRLDIRVAYDNPHLPAYLAFLEHLLSRSFAPLPRLSISSINGEKAPASPYVALLRQGFEVSVDPKAVTLWRRV